MPNQLDPTYVIHGGELSYPAPVVCQGANLYGFILRGQADKLQQLCARVFAEPSGGQASYVPVSSLLMLTVGRIDRVYSSSLNQGYSVEKQAIFWLLTGAARQVGPVTFIDRLAFFPVYAIVDDVFSMVSGREVYGFFKSHGWIDVPDTAIANPPRLGLDVYGLQTFSPDSEARRYPLFELTSSGAGDAPLGAEWRSPEEAFRDLHARVGQSLPKILLPGIELPISVLMDLLHREVPLVFLKQIRNAGVDGGASYQAVIEAPSRVNAFNGIHLLEPYQFTILNTLADYPLADDLGLASQTPLASFNVSMDFVVEAGREVWNAHQLTGWRGLLARWLGVR